LILFVFGFFIPYIYNCLALIDLQDVNEESQVKFICRWVLYSLCSLTQIYFIRIEFAEIMTDKIQNYINEVYNIFDFTLPIYFFVHLALRLKYKKINEFGNLRLIDNIIEILIIIASFFKTFQYLRIYKNFSLFV
jgi:hypothetical protein